MKLFEQYKILIMLPVVIAAMAACSDNRSEADSGADEKMRADSAEAELCVKTSFSLAGLDGAKAKVQAEKAVRLGLSSGNLKAAGDGYCLLGLCNRGEPYLDSIVPYLLKGVELFEKAGLKKNLANVYNNLGVFHQEFDEYEKALEYYKKSFENSDHRDSAFLATHYGNIGNTYFGLGDFVSALNSYEKAKIISAENNLADMTGILHNSIGNVFFEWGMTEKALEYYRKSYSTQPDTKLSDYSGASLSNIGSVYEKLGLLDSSIFYYEKAVQAFEAGGRDYEIPTTKLKMARSIALSGNLTDGEKLVRESRIEVVNSGPESRIADYHHFFGTLNRLKSNYPTAIRRLDSAAAVMKRFKSYRQLIGVLEEKVMCDVAIGDFKSAIKDQSAIDSLNEFLRNQAGKYEILQLEAKFEVAEKDHIISRLELENGYATRISYYLYSIIAFLSFSSFVVYVLYRRNRRAGKRLKISEASLIRSNKMKDKFYSIISHDLLNPISSIDKLTELLVKNFDTIDDEKKFKHIKRLRDSADGVGELLKNLLVWTGSQTNPSELVTEKANIRALVEEVIHESESVLAEKSLQVINNIDDTLEIEVDKSRLQTVFRNLVANAAKFSYGFGEILIESYGKDKKQFFAVEDFGVGIENKTAEDIFKLDLTARVQGGDLKRGSGLGLRICKEFVTLHGGEIFVESKSLSGKGARLVFYLPSESTKRKNIFLRFLGRY